MLIRLTLLTVLAMLTKTIRRIVIVICIELVMVREMLLVIRTVGSAAK